MTNSEEKITVNSKVDVKRIGKMLLIRGGLYTCCVTLIAALGLIVMINMPQSWREPNTSKTQFIGTFDPVDDGNLTTLMGITPGFNVILNGHSHTDYSSSTMTPKQNLQWHIANGYNATFVTDHNEVTGAQESIRLAKNDTEFKDKLVVLPGIEWTSCRGHYNLLIPEKKFMELSIRKDSSREKYSAVYDKDELIVPLVPFPTDKEMKDTFKKIKDLEGIVMLNHYPLGDKFIDQMPNRTELEKMGVDYYEIANLQSFDLPGFQFVNKYGMGLLAGGAAPRANTKAYGWSTLKVSNFNNTEIWKELRATNVDFMFDPRGSAEVTNEPSTRPEYEFYGPLIWIGEYFTNYYSYDKGTWSYTEYGYCEGTPKFGLKFVHILAGLFWGFILWAFYQMVYILCLVFAKYLFCMPDEDFNSAGPK